MDITLVITAIICLCPIIFVWNKLPEIVPIHFGPDGNPDNYGPRWANVILLPVVMALLNAVIHITFKRTIGRAFVIAGFIALALSLTPFAL